MQLVKHMASAVPCVFHYFPPTLHAFGCDWLIGGLGGAFSPSEAHVSIMDAARVPSQCPEGVFFPGQFDVYLPGQF